MKSFPTSSPAAPPELARASGYTLMEILIATGLLAFLGSGLVSLLTYAVGTWRTAENRGRVHDAARAVLDRIAEDLRSAASRSHSADDDSWVRFICDSGPDGRQRLRFVRATSGEAADSILREGGRFLSVRSPAVADGRGDAKESAAGALAAPGGLMEVLYQMDPAPGSHAFLRGSRSPAGGPDSLLIDKNVEEEPQSKPLERPKPAAPAAAGAGNAVTNVAEAKGADSKAADPKADPSKNVPPPVEETGPRRVASPIAEDVLHVGFAFWTATTNTWRAVPTVARPKPGEPSGPTPWWDSTRALLETQAGPSEFAWKRRPGSLDDSRDDVFPELVEVTVVIGDASGGLGPRLAEDVAESAKSIAITAPVTLPEDPRDRLVLIDDEWIELESADGLTLTPTAKGRGARFTKAAKHERGAAVDVGTTFRRVIEVPCGRSSVDVEEPKTSRGGRRTRP